MIFRSVEDGFCGAVERYRGASSFEPITYRRQVNHLISLLCFQLLVVKACIGWFLCAPGDLSNQAPSCSAAESLEVWERRDDFVQVLQHRLHTATGGASTAIAAELWTLLRHCLNV